MDLMLRYKDSNADITKRKISKITLTGSNEFEAFCHLRNATRTFKLHRIVCVIDPQTGNFDKNFWHYFGTSQEANIAFLVAPLLPTITALKMLSYELRGFGQRERRHVVHFIAENIDVGNHSEESIDAWLKQYKCGYVERHHDIYDFKNSDILKCLAVIKQIPDNLMAPCRNVAMKIAKGSGRKPIPLDLIDWIYDTFKCQDFQEGRRTAMALISCPECKREVSDRAAACPHCGYVITGNQVPIGPLKEMKSRSAAILLSLLLGSIGAHKFYVDKPGAGVVYLLFCWTFIPGIFGIIEAIQYATMSNEVFQQKYAEKKL